MEREDGRCAVTKISLELRNRNGKTRQSNPFLIASLDRIDNSLFYQEGNVQWISVAMNFARNKIALDEFKEYLEEFIRLKLLLKTTG